MNKKRLTYLLATLLFAPVPAWAQPLERLIPGVVKLYVKKAGGLDDTGAGIVVGLAEGTVFILTAHHVIGDAESIKATFNSKRWKSFDATTLKYDESMDIAVVWVHFDAPDEPPTDLPKYQIRDADPHYKEGVTAIGHPSDQLEWHPSPEFVAKVPTEDLRGFLTTRSQAERGFSGGPVFNDDGALLGIVVSVATHQTKVVLARVAHKKLKIWGVPANHLVTEEQAKRAVADVATAAATPAAQAAPAPVLSLGPLVLTVEPASGCTQREEMTEAQAILDADGVLHQLQFVLECTEGPAKGALIYATYGELSRSAIDAQRITDTSLPRSAMDTWGVGEDQVKKSVVELPSGINVAQVVVSGMGSGREFLSAGEVPTVGVWIHVPFVHRQGDRIKSTISVLYFRGPKSAANAGGLRFFYDLTDTIAPAEGVVPASVEKWQ